MKIAVIDEEKELFEILLQIQTLDNDMEFVHLTKENNKDFACKILNSSSGVIIKYDGGSSVVSKPLKISNIYSILQNIVNDIPIILGTSGEYKFYPNKALIETNGEKISLTETESAILHLIYNSQPTPLTKEDILSSPIFNYKNTTETHNLETHIYRIRQKLPNLIITQNNGYVFNLL